MDKNSKKIKNGYFCVNSKNYFGSIFYIIITITKECVTERLKPKKGGNGQFVGGTEWPQIS